MRDDDRIVVTGLGAVTPIGNTVDDFWKSLTGGVSGVGRITQFDPVLHQPALRDWFAKS